MNAITRRIATTVAAVALAGGSVATTGSAAFAGKPGGTTPIVVVNGVHHWTETDTWDYSVGYNVPVAAKSIQTVTCTLDGAPLADCGQATASKKSTEYFRVVIQGEAGIVQHEFAVTVTTKGASYAGSVTFAGFDNP